MEINQKIDKTVDWLREKVKEAGCKGLVVGVVWGYRFSGSLLPY